MECSHQRSGSAMGPGRHGTALRPFDQREGSSPPEPARRNFFARNSRCMPTRRQRLAKPWHTFDEAAHDIAREHPASPEPGGTPFRQTIWLGTRRICTALIVPEGHQHSSDWYDPSPWPPSVAAHV